MTYPQWERGLSWCALCVAGIAFQCWGIAVVFGGGLWAAVGWLVAAAWAGFCAVWVARPKWLPPWSGLVGFALTAVPLVYGHAMLPGDLFADWAFTATVGVMVAAGTIYSRRVYEREQQRRHLN
jgi:hypothetical protein